MVMAPLQHLSGKKEGGDDYSGSGMPDSRTRDIANLKQQACQFLNPPRSVSSIFKVVSDILSTNCQRAVQRGLRTASRHFMGCSRDGCVCVCVCIGLHIHTQISVDGSYILNSMQQSPS